MTEGERRDIFPGDDLVVDEPLKQLPPVRITPRLITE
jgi:hypothetical protein